MWFPGMAKESEKQQESAVAMQEEVPTSAEVALNGGLVGESHQNPLNSG